VNLSRAASRLGWRWTVTACSLFVVGFGVWMVLNLGGSRATTWVDDTATFAVALLATIASVSKARSLTGRERAGWIWIAAGAGCLAVGEAIWGWYALINVEQIPSPSVADVFYLLGELVAVIGILLLASRSGQFTKGFRHVLDGFVIAGSLLFVSWSSALGAIYRLGGPNMLAREVALAYPVIDIIACTAALAALSKVRGHRRRALALIGIGLLAFAISDSAYSYLTSINAYGNGSAFDTGYIAGYLLIFLAAVVPASPHDTVAEEAEVSMPQTVLPYVPLCVALVVAVVRAASGARFDGLLMATGAVTIAVVLVRQLLTLIENVTLTGRLQSSVAELRAREEELAYKASHDPLTGLPNRVLFADRVAHALDRRLRAGTMMAVMVCDLDEFKSINDTLGHPVGDEVLRTVAQRLVGCLRAGDTVARLSGDEFGVLVEDLSGPEAALESAARLTASVRPSMEIAGNQVAVSTSIGIALTVTPTDTAQSLLRDADVGLYEAKGAGKDRFRVVDSEMLKDVFADIALKNDLRSLAEHPEQLELHYQPIVDVFSGALCSVEALVRWRHPRHGLIHPDGFIARAEETGAIIPIGAAVIEEACAQMASWREMGLHCPPVAVNVSPRQLREASLVPTIKRALEAHAIPPHLLTIEITEGVLMRSAEQAVTRLRQLKSLGLTIAIDDFGTGYSSLAYLRRMPVDVLKIDRSFTNEIDDMSPTVVLMDLMNQIGHALGLVTVIEGVETPEQMNAIRLLGCDRAQGFLIARPMPAVAMTSLIMSRSVAGRADDFSSPLHPIA
jgi:diguanylate cyclase (GGDEF)-like protein